MANMPQAQANVSGDTVSALVAKHRAEIDRVKLMDSKGQMAEFQALGIDPGDIMAHYKTLVDRADALQEADIHATTYKRQLGLASLAVGTVGAYFGARKLTQSKIFKFFAVPIAGIGSYLAGTFVGSRLFAGRIREDSRLNDIEAKNAFERELAVALENKKLSLAYEMQPAKVDQPSGPAGDGLTKEIAAMPLPDEKTFASAAPQRDASFAAQASADTASQNAQRSL